MEKNTTTRFLDSHLRCLTPFGAEVSRAPGLHPVLFLGKGRKFPNRASAVDESSTCILPVPFQDLVAAIVVERIDLGEEVGYHYVSSVLEVAIEQWNECVGILKKELESPEAVLKQIDAEEATSERDLEAAIEEIRAQALLRTISLTKNDGEYVLLGFVFMCFASFALGSQFATLRVLLFAWFCIIYIYTYKCQNPLAEIGGNAACMHMFAFHAASCFTLVPQDLNSPGEQLETRAPLALFTPYSYGRCAGLGELPDPNPQGTQFAPSKLWPSMVNELGTSEASLAEETQPRWDCKINVLEENPALHWALLGQRAHWNTWWETWSGATASGCSRRHDRQRSSWVVAAAPYPDYPQLGDWRAGYGYMAITTITTIAIMLQESNKYMVYGHLNYR